MRSELEEAEKEDGVNEQQQCHRTVHDESLAAAVVVLDKEVGKKQRDRGDDDGPQEPRKIVPRLAWG
jgi:hypothetical protein